MGHGKIAFSAAVLATLAPFALGAIGCKSADPPMPPQDPTSTTMSSSPTAASTTTLTSGAASLDPAPSMALQVETTPSAAIPASTPATTPTGATTAVASLTDAQIVAVVDASGRGERLEAHEAMKKANSARVRQLAQLVLSNHDSAKLDRLERVSSLAPVSNPLSVSIAESRDRNAQQLKSAAASDFDRAYVAAQLAAGRHMIELLDDKLIPQAQNGELRSFLQDLRTSTASNVGMARDIKGHVAE